MTSTTNRNHSLAPAACAAALVILVGCRAAEPSRAVEPLPQAPAPLVIVVHEGGWGEASLTEVASVLASTATTFLRHAPGRIAHAVSVSQCSTTGRCLDAPFTRREGDQYYVQLGTKDRYWSSYAYEFAHELCHVLASSAAPEATWHSSWQHPNRWFEEALCETASLYALRAMARAWEIEPPYPNWRTYAPVFREHADARTRVPATWLEPGQTLASWYRANAQALRDVEFDRERESMVAGALLPMFEADPAGWDAVGYIHLSGPGDWVALEVLFAAWYRHVPPNRRGFVSALALKFGYPAP